MEWHSMSAAAVLRELKSDAQRGLPSAAARQRLALTGKNKLAEGKKRGAPVKFFSQFKDFMVIILLIASAISFAVAVAEKSNEFLDSIIILVIVILNAVMGAVQESRAEKALDALKALSAPRARAVRDGRSVSLPAEELTAGDVIMISAGDLVPADARLIEASGLKMRESALTGEAMPCSKSAELILSPDCAPADRKNTVFSGTEVVAGHGKAVVTETGMNTGVGKIAGLLSTESAPKTPLQQRLAKIGRLLGIAAITVCAGIFLLGLARRASLLDSFMLSVSLAVAAIPEGLPAIVTVVLSLGVARMAKHNAVIRRLPAVETLGAATFICSDKTGTLTLNRMTVTQVRSAVGIVPLSGNEARGLLSLGAQCCNSVLVGSKGKLDARGEPTENAIVLAADAAGISLEALTKNSPRVSELPFDSSRKMMTVVCRESGRLRAVTKGAPDYLLARCDRVLVSGAVVPMSEMRRRTILDFNESMGREALRVLGVAYKDVADVLGANEQGMIFCGLIGMTDPPRKEAGEAVRVCREAGITPVMITGDHAVTAKAIAAKLGISDENGEVLTGTQLDAMTESERAQRIGDCRVFARVAPEHKVAIVKALRARGEVVAMTGDGVNDAPALKAADIGCAMGKSGTEVAKSAADMVLTDDNFATIVRAVRLGRGIYDNIKKCVHFLLSSNIGEIFVILTAALMGMPAPLLPLQLLWVNFVTDSLPAMALGTESPDRNIMKRPPASEKSFFTPALWLDILLEGALLGALTLLAFLAGAEHSQALGRTMAFTTLSLSEIVHAFGIRSESSLLTIGFFSNKRLVVSALICSALQICAVGVPTLCALFGTVPLNFTQWATVVLLALVPLAASELSKLPEARASRRAKRLSHI